MANKTVSVDLVFNVKDGELVSATKRTDALATSTTKASKAAASGSGAFSTLGGSISKLAGVAGIALSLAALANAIKNQVSAAVRLNAEFETLTNRIAAQNFVNSQNVTTTGKAINAQEKWALSMKTAHKQMNDLKETSVKMGVSTKELTDAFSSFAGGAGKQMQIDELQESFTALSRAAILNGVGMNELIMGIDGVGTATVLVNSSFGRFLKNIGLTNEALREAANRGELYQLIMEKTAPSLEALKNTTQSYNQALASLKAAWNNLLQEVGSGYFEGIKKSINDLTAWINRYKDDLLRVIDSVISYFSEIANLIATLVRGAFEALGAAISWVVGLFTDATTEMSAFDIVLKGISSVMEGAALGFKTLGNAVMAIVNSLKYAIYEIQQAYYSVKDFFGLADDEDAAKMKRLVESQENAAQAVKNVWEKQVAETKETINGIYDNWTGKSTKKGQMPSADDSGMGSLQTAKSPLSSMTEGLAKSTKKQIDTLKSWWDAEFEIREKNLELMAESRQKELEAEQLRFDKVISNLNFEIQKKIESGEITLEQANALYEAEDKIHQKRMKSISEYNETYENLMKNINSALESNIQNALTGKFSNAGDFFKDLFSSMQQSFAQGLATSMAQAIMSTEVMKAFTSTFSTAIEGISGLFKSGAAGGVVNATSSGEGSGVMQTIGSVGAGAVTGYAFGDMVYNAVSDGYVNAATKYAKLGIGASAIAGAGAGAYVGSTYGPVGTAIGGLVGGVLGGISAALGFSFGGVKTEQTGSGVQLWANATKNAISASIYADMKETTKSWWGLKKSTKTWTEYYSADSQSLRNIRQALRSYEWFIEDINGSISQISVAAGRYSNYQAIINRGAKSTIAAILGIDEYVQETYYYLSIAWNKGFKIALNQGTRWVENPDLTAIYSVWESYAASVNKEVSTALAESLQSYVDTGNTFEAWKLEFEGKSTEALKFAADLANEQVERILEALGAKDVTIDNYLQYRETALKESFDPTTIEYINTLGEYLMSAAEATQKYEEALKDETATKLNLIDPFLAKTAKIEEINADNTSTSEKLNLQILSTLKQILRIDQENQNELYGTPAVAVARA